MRTMGTNRPSTTALPPYFSKNAWARCRCSRFRSLLDQPVSEWPARFVKDWDPKRDFAYAMLHAERLARLLVDEAISEILLKQARRHPERREVLERYLDRCEARVRYLADEITTSGSRLLASLAEGQAGGRRTAGGVAEAG